MPEHLSKKKSKWVPNDFHYEIENGEYTGVRLVKEALTKAGLGVCAEILTSKDPRVQKAQALLKKSGPSVPEGVSKWQLPVLFSDIKPTFMFVTVGAPNSVVSRHRHKDLCIFRFIVSGSINFGGTELVQGDWVMVPGGKMYSYQVGDKGVVILHKYVGL